MSKKADRFETAGEEDVEKKSSEEMVRKRSVTGAPIPPRENTPQSKQEFHSVLLKALFSFNRQCTFVSPSASSHRVVAAEEELTQTAKDVTNMALAHEILLNPDFRLKPAELPEGW